MPQISPSPSLRHLFWFRLVGLLTIVAICLSVYLSWVTLTHGTVAGCGAQASNLQCDDILRSPWSRVLGIPVSLLSCCVYVTILATLSGFHSTPSDSGRARWKRNVCQVAITLAVGAALWFLFLQFAVLHHLCIYCLSIHACGIAAGVIVGSQLAPLTSRRHRAAGISNSQQRVHQLVDDSRSTTKPSASSQGSPRARDRWRLSVAGGGLVLLILLQVLFPSQTHELVDASDLLAESNATLLMPASASERPTSEPDSRATATATSTSTDVAQEIEQRTHAATPPTSDAPAVPEGATSTPLAAAPAPRMVKFLKGRLELDITQHGILGSPQAECVMIELVDYTCPDCRQMHQRIAKVREHFGDQFAVVVFPVPLETKCNPYIRTTHEKHIGACQFANLALAVLAVAPAEFPAFHDWLMDAPEPPSFEAALQRAQAITGTEELQTQTPSSRLKAYVRLYGQSRVPKLPAVIVEDQIMVGVPGSVDDVIQMVNGQLQTNRSHP